MKPIHKWVGDGLQGGWEWMLTWQLLALRTSGWSVECIGLQLECDTNYFPPVTLSSLPMLTVLSATITNDTPGIYIRSRGSYRDMDMMRYAFNIAVFHMNNNNNNVRLLNCWHTAQLTINTNIRHAGWDTTAATQGSTIYRRVKPAKLLPHAAHSDWINRNVSCHH